MAILSFSGNVPVFVTWFINRVNDVMMAGSIIFNSFDEIPSQLFFFCWKAFYNFIYVFFVYVFKSEYRVNSLFKVITIILIAIVLNSLCNSLTYTCKIVTECICNICLICYINAIFFKIKYLFALFLERISFLIFQVFLMSFLERLKHK